MDVEKGDRRMRLMAADCCPVIRITESSRHLREQCARRVGPLLVAEKKRPRELGLFDGDEREQDQLEA